MIVTIEHRDAKGKVNVESFNIDFVSSWMTDKFFEVEQMALQYVASTESLKDLNVKAVQLRHKIEALRLDGVNENGPQQIEELEKKLDSVREEIKKIVHVVNTQGAEFFARERLKIVAEILNRNGYEDRREFFDLDFWEKNVSANGMANFIAECVTQKKTKIQA